MIHLVHRDHSAHHRLDPEKLGCHGHGDSEAHCATGIVCVCSWVRPCDHSAADSESAATAVYVHRTMWLDMCTSAAVRVRRHCPPLSGSGPREPLEGPRLPSAHASCLQVVNRFTPPCARLARPNRNRDTDSGSDLSGAGPVRLEVNCGGPGQFKKYFKTCDAQFKARGLSKG